MRSADTKRAAELICELVKLDTQAIMDLAMEYGESSQEVENHGRAQFERLIADALFDIAAATYLRPSKR